MPVIHRLLHGRKSAAFENKVEKATRYKIVNVVDFFDRNLVHHRKPDEIPHVRDVDAVDPIKAFEILFDFGFRDPETITMLRRIASRNRVSHGFLKIHINGAVEKRVRFFLSQDDGGEFLMQGTTPRNDQEHFLTEALFSMRKSDFGRPTPPIDLGRTVIEPNFIEDVRGAEFAEQVQRDRQFSPPGVFRFDGLEIAHGANRAVPMEIKKLIGDVVTGQRDGRGIIAESHFGFLGVFRESFVPSSDSMSACHARSLHQNEIKSEHLIYKYSMREFINITKDLDTENNLSEGLIKIPTLWLKKGRGILITQMITWAEHRLKDSKNAEMNEAVAQLRRQYADEIVPKWTYKPDSKVVAMNVKTDDLEGSYEGLKAKTDILGIAVVWMEREDHGIFMIHRDTVAIFPLSWSYLRNFGNERTHPDDLRIGLEAALSTLEHELRHAVQFILLPHEHQRKQKPGYKDYKGEYLTSPVEFDPTIGSAVREYMDYLEAGEKHSRRFLEIYLGLRKTGMFGVQPHPMFKALRKDSPVQYRVAIKKFLGELANKLSVPKS